MLGEFNPEQLIVHSTQQNTQERDKSTTTPDLPNMATILVRAGPGTPGSMIHRTPGALVECVKRSISATGYTVSDDEVEWINTGTFKLDIKDATSSDVISILHSKKCTVPAHFGGMFSAQFDMELSAPSDYNKSFMYLKNVIIIRSIDRTTLYNIISSFIGQPLHSITSFLFQRRPCIRIAAFTDVFDDSHVVDRIITFLENIAMGHDSDSDSDTESVASVASDTEVVAGAFSSNYSCFSDVEVGSSSSSSTDSADEGSDNELLCKVCYSNPLQNVCSPCGHMYMCMECVQQQVDRHMPACCGICKCDIADIFTVKL
jgi:Zinc finger, C3HC4 type (RING finger)